MSLHSLKIAAITVQLLFLASPAVASATVYGLREVIKLEDGSHIQVSEFPGAHKWAFFRYLFTSTSVVVRCPGHTDFQVFTARTLQGVKDAYARKDRAWCGWDRFLARNHEVCVTPIPPVGSSFVAVSKPKGWFSKDAADTACYMDYREELSTPRVLAAVMGAFLFYAAPQLAESTPFRLAGGSLGFAALSAVVVLFIMYRSVPHKRRFAAGALVLGSSMAGAARWAFGTWLPSLAQMAQNPIVLGYAAMSALMGLAITYYYNDETNRKVNTMLRVALQLAGLTMLTLSASSREGSALALAIALGSRLVLLVAQEHGVLPALRRARLAVQLDLQESIPPPAAAEQEIAADRVRLVLVTPSSPVTPAAAAPTPPVSPLVEQGLLLNVKTGKTIGIGKGTYHKLIDEGYIEDRVAGTLTPPPESPDAGSGSGSSARRRSRGRR